MFSVSQRFYFPDIVDYKKKKKVLKGHYDMMTSSIFLLYYIRKKSLRRMTFKNRE